VYYQAAQEAEALRQGQPATEVAPNQFVPVIDGEVSYKNAMNDNSALSGRSATIGQ